MTQQIESFSTKNKLFFLLVSLYYRFLVKRETLLANISENDKILCVGGGVCPYTAILLNKYTNAQVTVIDNNSTCVDQSKKFIKHLGLDKIKVFLCEAECVNCSNYSVIHIAMQISPKDIVINEVIKKSKDGTKILVRKPKEHFKKLYSNVSEQKGRFTKNIKHGFLSNVASTSVCVVNKKNCFKFSGAL